MLVVMQDMDGRHGWASSSEVMTSVVVLSLLTVPRLVLHDLDVMEDNSLLSGILGTLPYVLWVVVPIARRYRRLFLPVLAAGLLSGVWLLIGHFLLWNIHWAGHPNPPSKASVLIPSIFVGLGMGAIVGLVTLGIGKSVRYFQRSTETREHR